MQHQRAVDEDDHRPGLAPGPVGRPDGLGLRRLLEMTMDSVTLNERDGGAWVDLRKGYALAGSES